MVVFDRPVGAPADVQELEYVSALHQTAAEARVDGSINAEDVQLYLRSRFGLDVSLETVRSTIFQGMGGSANDSEVIDLMELTAILFIPYLIKLSKVQAGDILPEGVAAPTTTNTVAQVLAMMLHDVGIDDKNENNANNNEANNEISPALVRRILNAYGEHELADNPELVQQMLHQLRGHTHLTPEALAQALTADVRLYDLQNETRYSNTYSDIMERRKDDLEEEDEATLLVVDAENAQSEEDVFVDEYKENDDQKAAVMDESTSLLKKKKPKKGIIKTDHQGAPTVVKRYTAPAIDSTNGTYRSKTLIVVLWASVLFNYISFTAGDDNSDYHEVCEPYIVNGSWEDNQATVYCNITNSIVDWLFLFLFLCLFGMIWIGCGSLGNADGNKRLYKPIVALGFLFFFTILPNMTFDFEGHVSVSERYIRMVAIVLGSTAMLLHVLHLLFLCFDWCCANACGIRDALNRHVNKDEKHLKESIAYKVDRLVGNAMDIHHTADEQNIVKSCFGYGLHVFSKWNKTERVGGLFWVWRSIWSGKIFCQEGLWFSARLSAANLSQYIVVAYIAIIFFSFRSRLVDSFGKEGVKEQFRGSMQYLIDEHVSEAAVEGIAAQIGGVVGNFVQQLNDLNVSHLDCEGIIMGAGMGTMEDTVNAHCPEGNDFFECDSLYQNSIVSEHVNSTLQLCTLLTRKSLEVQDQLQGFEELVMLKGAGLDANELISIVKDGVGSGIDHAVDSLYPNRLYMLTLPVTVAAVVATLASLSLAVSYFPSITSTTLQLRSGVIPLLRDQKKLNTYRAGPDTVTTLTGALFWGCLFSGLLMGTVAGVAVFFVVWQRALYYTQRGVAVIIGVAVIATIRTLIITIGRKSMFHSFYRSHPAGANIYFLAMEWANFALSAGFVFVRLVQLLIVACLNVGRIDTAFLAKGVGTIGGVVNLDPFPDVHMRDILATEAHRHPYLELMGKVYLMKLKYGTKFGSNAGSCWRLLFVYALMPWMQKYRIFDNNNNTSEQQDDENKVDGHSGDAIQSLSHPSPPSAETASLSSVKALQSENDALRRRLKELEQAMLRMEAKAEAESKPKTKSSLTWFSSSSTSSA